MATSESDQQLTPTGKKSWELWRHLIRIEYIVEDKTLSQVLTKLHELGFHATQVFPFILN